MNYRIRFLTAGILDQTLTYEVDQIRIVLPEETDDLEIVETLKHFGMI